MVVICVSCKGISMREAGEVVTTHAPDLSFKRAMYLFMCLCLTCRKIKKYHICKHLQVQ